MEPKFSNEFLTIPDALIDVSLADDVHLLDTFLQQGGEMFINSFGRYDRTPLMLSAAWNASQSVALLLRRGANVHLKDLDGNTALHLAAENNAKKSLQALIHGHALVDDQNVFGYTALHITAAQGYLACTKDLLIAGARANLLTKDDHSTPLDLALKEGHQAIVMLLRSWDPSWSTRQNDSQTLQAMQMWTCDQVAEFLRKLAMSQYVPVFLDQEIDGLALSEMTDEKLEMQLKIDRPLHRVRLLEAILFTQIHHEAPKLPAPDESVLPQEVPRVDEEIKATLPPVSPVRRRQRPSPYLAKPSVLS